MTCMGNNSPDKVMTKVRVMLLLSVKPFIGTDDALLAGGILFSVIILLMSVRYISLHSSNIPLGTGGRVVFQPGK